jgi:hypothetical protein
MVISNDISPSESDVMRMEQELSGNIGQQELEEDTGDDDEHMEYNSEGVRRFLPNLAPGEGGRQRNISILEQGGAWTSPTTRRWSSTESQLSPSSKGSQQPPVQQSPQNLPRFTQSGNLSLGGLPENQDIDHEWPQQPPRAKAFFSSDSLSSPNGNPSGQFGLPRGRSASTMAVSSYNSVQSDQY